MRNYIVAVFFLVFSLPIGAQGTTVPQDTLNIPVILVDGVEIQAQNLDSIDKEDIIEVKVIKDKSITKYFYPRVGGLMCITTKSKKYLTPIIQRYKENSEAIDKKKKKGELYIR